MVAGCASDDAISKVERTGDELRIGTTKERVVALYGLADDIRRDSEGELWIYYLNVGKQFVPWNLGYSPELRVIQFDETGRVKSWNESK